MIRYEMPMEVVAGCPVCGPDREATPARERLVCSDVKAEGAAASPRVASAMGISERPIRIDVRHSAPLFLSRSLLSGSEPRLCVLLS